MEAMALESLVASVWKLEGFVSVTRYPVRVDGGYSDIDVLGVSGDGKIRLAECKARGPARRVYIEGQERNEDSKPPWTERWDKSLENVERIWEKDSRPLWFPPDDSIKQFEFHLVGNVWFADEETRHAAEERLTAKVRQLLLRSKIRKVGSEVGLGRVFSSVELLTRAIRLVREDVVGEKKWGKRYGDPHLDALRELVRYAHPVPKGASGTRTAITESLKKDLLASLFDKPGDVRS